MLVGTTRHRRPADRTAAAVSSSVSSVRPATTTSAPKRAKASAVVRPMPRAPAGDQRDPPGEQVRGERVERTGPVRPEAGPRRRPGVRRRSPARLRRVGRGRGRFGRLGHVGRLRHRRAPYSSALTGDPVPVGSPRGQGWRPMSWTRRLILPGRCLLAGLCIAASVPPWGWWPLAFVGIALLDRLIADQPWKRRFRRTWLVAAAWLFPALFWIWDLTAPGYLVAGFALRGLLRGGRRAQPAGAGPLAGAARAVPLGRGRPLDLPLRGRAPRDAGHEPGRGPARPDGAAARRLPGGHPGRGRRGGAVRRLGAGLEGGRRHRRRCSSCSTAWPWSPPGATTSGRCGSPSCRAAAPSTPGPPTPTHARCSSATSRPASS